MVEDFVSYEQAVRLKTAGFDWPCEAFYEHVDGKMWIATDGKENWNSGVDCSAPSLAQAAKWLREVKGIEVIVEPRFSNYKRIGYDWAVYDDFSGDYALRAPLPFSPSHETALSAGITATIELLEGKG